MSPVPVDPVQAVAHNPALAGDVNARFLELYKTFDPGVRGIDIDNIAASLRALFWKPGMVVAIAAVTADDGFLLCDGAAVSRTGATQALFDRIGTVYGVGNGTSTFNLPDFRGRVLVGVDGAAARLSASDSLGDAAGEQTHVLTPGETAMKAHSHGGVTGGMNASNPHQHSFGAGGSGIQPNIAAGGAQTTNYLTAAADINHGHAISAETAADGGAHNNMQPYQVVNWQIKT